MKIGIFGGSFNPIHRMHISIANQLISKHYVDKLIFVPTGDQYSYKNNMLSAKERYKMISLVCDNNKLLVNDFEIKASEVHTYDTLEYFKNIYPNDEIYFVCGTDNLSYIESWYRAAELLNNFHFLVINRNGNDISTLAYLLEKYDSISVVDIDMDDISSSKIREALSKGNDVSDYLDPKVYNYILDNNFYK